MKSHSFSIQSVFLCSAVLLAAMLVPSQRVGAECPAAVQDDATKTEKKVELKPDVAALLKQSTDAYKKMKSYRQTARWSLTAKGPEGDVHEELLFTLALDRPNKFVYKMDSTSKFFPAVGAYSDGTTFINFKGRSATRAQSQYIKGKSPESYKGINIVDDVEFQPIGTYIIALMLQGDALADKDVRAAMEKSTLQAPVTENGKKWQVLEMPFGQDQTPWQIYFGQDDHLIGKAVQKGDTRINEAIEGVKIDKPVEATVFTYTLPAEAKEVKKFTAPQRPDDALLTSRRAGRHIARR